MVTIIIVHFLNPRGHIICLKEIHTSAFSCCFSLITLFLCYLQQIRTVRSVVEQDIIGKNIFCTIYVSLFQLYPSNSCFNRLCLSSEYLWARSSTTIVCVLCNLIFFRATQKISILIYVSLNIYLNELKYDIVWYVKIVWKLISTEIVIFKQ